MKTMFLGGGGRFDSRPLDENFVSWLSNRPMMYWPIALDPVRDYDRCLVELRERLSFGYTGEIDMWRGSPSDSLPPFGRPGHHVAIYIDGGNAYRLLDEIKKHHLLKRLRNFVATGGVVYGDSAGAALLGVDIDTVVGLDENAAHLQNTSAVNAVYGLGIFVHHGSARRPVVDEWVRRHKRCAIALGEKAGAIFHDNQLKVVGNDEAWFFSLEGVTPLDADTTYGVEGDTPDLHLRPVVDSAD